MNTPHHTTGFPGRAAILKQEVPNQSSADFWFSLFSVRIDLLLLPPPPKSTKIGRTQNELRMIFSIGGIFCSMYYYFFVRMS